MSKSFRDLVEAINSREAKEKAPTNGKVGGEPKADGEKAFAKAHGYPVEKGGEYDYANSTKNSDDVLNARKQKEADLDSAGQKDSVQQGTSKLKDLSGFMGKKTPARRGDSKDGNKVAVRMSPSSVEAFKEEVEDIAEDNYVVSDLVKIVKSGKSSKVNFRDGDATLVNVMTAKKMMEIYNQLNPDNAEKFRETVNKNAAGFLKMMNFTMTSRKGSK